MVGSGLRLTFTAAMTAWTTLSSAAPVGDVVGAPDLDRARELLVDFDRAWAARDLDGLMKGFSPYFGCDLYGNVDAADLRATFDRLLEHWPDSVCQTHVLGLSHHADLIQATVCRQITDGAPSQLDELCHLIYLRKVDDEMQIVGLEEYSHTGFGYLDGREYHNTRVGYRLTVPDGMFAVPTQRVGFTLDHLMLRGDDLQCAISVVIFRSRQPVRLEQDLRQDIDMFRAAHPPSTLELYTETALVGYPAIRAEVSYRGEGCSLRGRQKTAASRTRVRIFAQLGEHYVMGIDADAPTRTLDDTYRALDELTASIGIPLPDGVDFPTQVESNHGWGRVDGERITHEGSGLTLLAPGYQLAKWDIHDMLVVSARSTDDPDLVVWLDVYPVLRQLELDEQIEHDDQHYLQVADCMRWRAEVSAPVPLSLRSGADARRVDRQVRSPDGRSVWVESQVYIAVDGYGATARLMPVPESRRQAATAALVRLLDGLTFAPR